MPTLSHETCPHCRSAIAFLEGVTGATYTPSCPRCSKPVTVERPTKLIADYSRRT